MASQALYLKYRPQRFEDVVGQDHVTQTLKNALRSGRISHAYLFSGPRGTGKTTMARLLAKAVNCLDEDLAKRPCNQCAMCRSVNEGRLLDLIEIDAASHTGVDNVRETIRDKVGFRPTEARYKVYVIDEVHMLSTSAFNALLKTLEEPPEHVIFCLATTEPQKVLATILSRCQQFDFHRISLSALVERLRFIADQEGIQVEPDALEYIARASTGCARDAISLLDQLTAYGEQAITVDRLRSVLGLGDAQLVHRVVQCMADRRVGDGLDVISLVAEQGADARQFTHQVIEYMRGLLLLRVGSKEALADLDAQTRRDLVALQDQVNVRDLVRWIKLFNQAQLDLRGSDQNQVVLELAFVEAAMAPEAMVVPAPLSAAPALAVDAPERAPVPPVARSVQPQQSQPAATAALPAAPPRAGEGGHAASVQEETENRAEPGALAAAIVPLTMAEVDEHWPQIRHAIRERSRQVEALVNSAVQRRIQNTNQIVFEFASDFLSSKLEKEESRRVVEQVMSEVIGKLCRVQSVVQGSAPETPAAQPAARSRAEPPASPAQSPSVEVHEPIEVSSPPFEEPPLEDDLDPGSDPVVQDLLRLGGKIKDVQTLSDE